MSLAILDLDHFKQINDQHGHLIGDVLLQEVARRLSSLVREGELLARVGGEEFAWILPDAEGVGAFAAAERARLAISHHPFTDIGRVTLSAGVADLAHATHATELYERADQALYWAKQHGRDQTFRYSIHTAEQLRRPEAADEAEAASVEALVDLALAAEDQHPDLSGHSQRVSDLAAKIAQLAGWTEAEIEALRQAALLHDIGNVALPEGMLARNGALTPGELAQLRTHAGVGAEMLTAALTPKQAAWVRHHHERWDGAGYPSRLAGEAIPEGAQLLAVADAYDAMTHHRPYREALTPDLAMFELHSNAGAQFTPRAVKLLETALEERRNSAVEPIVSGEGGIRTREGA